MDRDYNHHKALQSQTSTVQTDAPFHSGTNSAMLGEQRSFFLYFLQLLTQSSRAGIQRIHTSAVGHNHEPPGHRMVENLDNPDRVLLNGAFVFIYELQIQVEKT